MVSYWQKIANMTGAATRFRVNGEMVRLTRLEIMETLRLAMNDECANRPYDAHSRQYCEGKLWPVIPGGALVRLKVTATAMGTVVAVATAMEFGLFWEVCGICCAVGLGVAVFVGDASCRSGCQ